MALARDNGQRVVCVTATRGELGTPDPVAWPPDRLAAERTRELARCLDDPRRHRAPLAAATATASAPRADPAEASRSCATVIDRVRPDTVLTFGPDGITGHPDHRTVSAWTGAAVRPRRPARGPAAARRGAERRAPRVGRARPTAWASTCRATRSLTPAERLAVDLVLDPDIAARKVRALAAQATQTAGLIAALGVDRYTAWVGEESFVEAVGAPVAATGRWRRHAG